MTRLLRVLCAVSLLCALYGEYAASFATPRIARATTMTAASAAQIVISPTSGPAGQSIQITLSNFTPNTEYDVQDSATGSILLTPLGTECSGTLDGQGAASQTCVIPATATPGNDTITAVDFAGLVATTTFDVLPAGGTPSPTATGSAVGSPQFAVSPSFGPLTQTIQVTLTSFTANSSYTVTDQATGEVLPGDLILSNCVGKGPTKLDASGFATRKCRLPSDFSMGLHTLVATDGAGVQATANFSVVPAGTTPTDTPSAVATNTAAPTNTPTSTATNTAITSPTPMQTATPTTTPGLTSTATMTPSATTAPADTNTATATATPTAPATPQDTAMQTPAGSGNAPTASADSSASPSAPASQAQPSAAPTSSSASLPPLAAATTTATAVTAGKKPPTKSKASCPAHPAKLSLSWTLKGLKGHSLTSGQTLTAAIHTLPNLSVTVMVKVQQKKTVTTGTGKKRKTVTRLVTLYQATVHGKTGKHGKVSPRLHVTYRPAKSVTAQVSVATAKGCSHATRSTHVSLLPAHKKPAAKKATKPSTPHPASTKGKSTKGKRHKS